jgi:triosephosphate isomerase
MMPEATGGEPAVRDISRPFFAANWKMHMGPSECSAFVARFVERYGARSDRRVVFFPPAVSIVTFVASTRGRRDLEVGVQDVHALAAGAHTGAISASMVADAGAGWGLAGHSERRREFGDGDELVGEKLARLLEAGIKPILCLGETLKEREENRLYEVLSRQIGAALRELDAGRREALAYAYEPVWAIGTGKTATPADASEAHDILRQRIAHLTSDATAERAIILYGGSVKPDNIDELLASDGVDGVLVGGASLNPESFAAICSAGSR